jgi:hypothetical protein
MANKCTYTLNSQKFDSFAELLNYLDNIDGKYLNEIGNTNDVVYSKFLRRDELHKQISEKSKEYVPKRRKTTENSGVRVMLDGEPIIRESGVLSI